MPSKQQQIGTWGEDRAVQWLQQHGYTILGRNYFAKVGEIDIIAEYRDTKRLCFIEVKTRKKRDGTAEYAHSPKKQQLIRQSAMLYCQEHAICLDTQEISFEHVSIYTQEPIYRVDHYIL